MGWEGKASEVWWRQSGMGRVMKAVRDGKSDEGSEVW